MQNVKCKMQKEELSDPSFYTLHFTFCILHCLSSVLSFVLPAAAALLLVCAVVQAEDWPQFRGPAGCGLSAEKNLPTTWGGKTLENVLWSSALIGTGNASPIVWNDRVFVCTVLWRPSIEPREKVMPEHHLLCYDAAMGKLLWDAQIPPGPWLRSQSRADSGGPYATPTPTTDGTLVYCVFGSAVVAAVDFQGQVVWRRVLDPYSFDAELGTSPILYKDTLILQCAMPKPKDSQIQVFDKRSGDVLVRWRMADMGFGHGTPLVINVEGKPQLLVAAGAPEAGARALRSLDPDSGRLLWWCRGSSEAVSPAFGAGLVYFDSGRGGAGVAVDPSGSGDVAKTHLRWSLSETPDAPSSPIIVGDCVYRLLASGSVAGRQLSDGKLWDRVVLAGVTSMRASPVADAEGHIFFATAGKSYVVKAGAELEILAVNDLGDPSDASPAIAGGHIFLAGRQRLYCIGKK